MNTGTSRKFKKKNKKFLHWFEASLLSNCGKSLLVPSRICQESSCTLQFFAASVAGSKVEVNNAILKHFGTLLLLPRNTEVLITSC